MTLALVIFRVCILLPTAGENLEVVFKALVGALSQRLWDSGLPGSQTLRVIVLDEKRRLEVYRVAAGVHRIGELLAGRRIQQILMVSQPCHSISYHSHSLSCERGSGWFVGWLPWSSSDGSASLLYFAHVWYTRLSPMCFAWLRWRKTRY